MGGNVASPLGDTSVLSSMVTKCDLMERCSSQATYVIFVGALALLVGTLPVGLGLYPAWTALLICLALMAAAPVLAKLACCQLCGQRLSSVCRLRQVTPKVAAKGEAS